MTYIRIDFLFSYWVLAWFLIYYFFPTLHLPSPKLGLILVLLENLVKWLDIAFFTPMKGSRKLFELVKFAGAIFLVKLWPLYLLRKDTIDFQQDSVNVAGLFLVYLLYLAAWGKRVLDVYAEANKSLKTGQDNTPLLRFFK